ncbi:MAG: transcriptional regulator [Theionarchaea archaeon]|nr:transcriptional regulator [Theionarchaea archaeon]MBU6999687.1 transcriptional regulator [Theionarchaea archaeon]MBU7022402.1 transcriptional regulator [Theionarchaea archaeon]MBU7035847.1 transcriptional regulator [Theionarchaea archaeon]MBU7041832.1 transcriptional regulator [Theionarchaea archaeon]
MSRDEGDGLRHISELDKLVHEPARLAIMAQLYIVRSADFLFLLPQTGLTTGNLSRHISKLEEAGYVKVEKEFVNKKPHTIIQLTEEGRAVFREYIETMKDIMKELSGST